MLTAVVLRCWVQQHATLLCHHCSDRPLRLHLVGAVVWRQQQKVGRNGHNGLLALHEGRFNARRSGWKLDLDMHRDRGGRRGQLKGQRHGHLPILDGQDLDIRRFPLPVAVFVTAPLRDRGDQRLLHVLPREAQREGGHERGGRGEHEEGHRGEDHEGDRQADSGCGVAALVVVLRGGRRQGDGRAGGRQREVVQQRGVRPVLQHQDRKDQRADHRQDVQRKTPHGIVVCQVGPSSDVQAQQDLRQDVQRPAVWATVPPLEARTKSSTREWS
mmetsp:Transcript_144174/g.461611  ORF Transcript_144174/g.461611 Transcript_144174/m.461611 type:complete len:272 (-) Transcript_144174:2545-3360(-)